MDGLIGEFATALCLVLVIEGLLVFASPRAWRRMIGQLAELDDDDLRRGAFVAIMIGALLYAVLR